MRELAAAPPRAERVRQLVRARHHRRAHLGLHQRLPLLEPAAAGGLDLSDVRSDGYAFLVELAWKASRAGGRILEVPDHVRRAPRGRVEALVGA